jgi:valyl-tRNA synthetase
MVGWVRATRAELAVDPKAELELFVAADDDFKVRLTELEPLARPLARLSGFSFELAPENAHQDKVAGVGLGLVIPEVEPTDRDLGRQAKERDELRAQITRIQELLSNEAFTTKAPEKVVNQNRQRLTELADRLEQLEAGLRES